MYDTLLPHLQGPEGQSVVSLDSKDGTVGESSDHVVHMNKLKSVCKSLLDHETSAEVNEAVKSSLPESSMEVVESKVKTAELEKSVRKLKAQLKIAHSKRNSMVRQ